MSLILRSRMAPPTDTASIPPDFLVPRLPAGGALNPSPPTLPPLLPSTEIRAVAAAAAEDVSPPPGTLPCTFPDKPAACPIVSLVLASQPSATMLVSLLLAVLLWFGPGTG